MALGDHLYKYLGDNLSKYSGNYLEIGVFDGDGFARIAAQYPDKKCYAIDPFLEDGYTTERSKVTRNQQLISQKSNFLNHTKNMNNVTHFEMTSVNFANTLTDYIVNNMNISCVLIDGSHHYDDVVNDYQLSLKLINEGRGFIIFDDLQIPDVDKAYNEFILKYKNIIKAKYGIGGSANAVELNYD